VEVLQILNIYGVLRYAAIETQSLSILQQVVNNLQRVTLPVLPSLSMRRRPAASFYANRGFPEIYGLIDINF
jgi:hypothetical protein